MHNQDLELSFLKGNLSLPESLSLEWLETNGLGGYASSTILNSHTRKYHGLLVSNLNTPSHPGKYVLLSKLDDIFSYKGTEYSLSSSQFPNYFQDSGFTLLKEFIYDTHPCFVYQIDDLIVRKEILMIHDENTVMIKYKILCDTIRHGTEFKIKPLLAYRNFHELTKANEHIETSTIDCTWGRRINPYPGLPPLFLQVSQSHDFLHSYCWYNNFEYTEEQSRGFDFHEDLFCPGVFVIPASKEIIFLCSINEVENDLFKKWDFEISRRQKVNAKLSGNNLQKQLFTTGLSFIQKNLIDQSKNIVAGYHWFENWGRDTMISLPGLTLCQKTIEGEKIFLEILLKYAEQEMDGLLPNILRDTKEHSDYNAVDVSLWFAWSLQQYYLRTKNTDNIKKHFWKVLKNIFTSYKNGTLFSIKMRDDGILNAGDGSVNITWMDAKVNNVAVTARSGAQVEVNALWFNMLCFMDELAHKFNDPIQNELEQVISSLQKSFLKTFWDNDLGYLRDYVNEKEINTALRPNQIFAISLPYSPVNKTTATKILKVVKENLLTPFGLRTLAPNDPHYVGQYTGGPKERDQAYHNGTIWPWLLGHFGEAVTKYSTAAQAKRILIPCIEALANHLREAGIGSISEIFAGDHPHKPNGCISQAWSVAEILRLTYLLRDQK